MLSSGQKIINLIYVINESFATASKMAAPTGFAPHTRGARRMPGEPQLFIRLSASLFLIVMARLRGLEPLTPSSAS